MGNNGSTQFYLLICLEKCYGCCRHNSIDLRNYNLIFTIPCYYIEVKTNTLWFEISERQNVLWKRYTANNLGNSEFPLLFTKVLHLTQQFSYLYSYNLIGFYFPLYLLCFLHVCNTFIRLPLISYFLQFYVGSRNLKSLLCFIIQQQFTSHRPKACGSKVIEVVQWM